jgi:hypothetical protein
MLSISRSIAELQEWLNTLLQEDFQLFTGLSYESPGDKASDLKFQG